jgi:hypothetical protein
MSKSAQGVVACSRKLAHEMRLAVAHYLRENSDVKGRWRSRTTCRADRHTLCWSRVRHLACARNAEGSAGYGV